MQTLTLKGGVSFARPAAPSDLYVLDDSARTVAQRPARARRAPEVMTHDRAIMRDLVLGAFLGPQFFREDEPARAAEYTTDKTRDAFPARLAADLAAVPTEGGPDGRLPKDYVTSLARGTTRIRNTRCCPILRCTSWRLILIRSMQRLLRFPLT